MADQPNSPSDETLIAFVRGTLPLEQADRIADTAARQPEVAAEIALFRGVAKALADEAREPAPGELGWARLSRAIDAGSVSATPKSRRPVWHLAATAAAAVLLWQVTAVPFFSDPPESDVGYAPVSEDPAARLTVMVAFSPTATEGAIRALLQEIDARVSDGPSAIGLWELSFETEAARGGGVERLRAAPGIVESVQ